MPTSKVRKKTKNKRQSNRPAPENSAPLNIEFSRKGHIVDKPIKIITRPTEEKMSQILLDFAEPFLAKIKKPHQIDKAITIAATVWNMTLLPQEGQKDAYNDLINMFGPEGSADRQMGTAIIDMLLNRKQKLYPDNKRLILSHKYWIEDGKHQVNVVSSAPQE